MVHVPGHMLQELYYDIIMLGGAEDGIEDAHCTCVETLNNYKKLTYTVTTIIYNMHICMHYV